MDVPYQGECQRFILVPPCWRAQWGAGHTWPSNQQAMHWVIFVGCLQAILCRLSPGPEEVFCGTLFFLKSSTKCKKQWNFKILSLIPVCRLIVCLYRSISIGKYSANKSMVSIFNLLHWNICSRNKLFSNKEIKDEIFSTPKCVSK